MFYSECCLSVETVQRFVEFQGVCKNSVMRAKEGGVIWLVVAQYYPIISIWTCMTNTPDDKSA